MPIVDLLSLSEPSFLVNLALFLEGDYLAPAKRIIVLALCFRIDKVTTYGKM
jgi:hypothetical protein